MVIDSELKRQIEELKAKREEFKRKIQTTGITREQFIEYESVRASGVTNMFNLPLVMELGDLTREQLMSIMRNYGDLKTFYGETAVREAEKKARAIGIVNLNSFRGSSK